MKNRYWLVGCAAVGAVVGLAVSNWAGWLDAAAGSLVGTYLGLETERQVRKVRVAASRRVETEV